MRRDHEIVVSRMDRQIAHRYRGEIAALVVRPLVAAVQRDPEAELGAEEEKVRVRQVFLDDVRVSAHRTIRGDQRRPGLPVVAGAVRVRPRVSEHVQVEGGVSCTLVEMAGVDRRNPCLRRQALDTTRHVRPRFAAVPRELQVAIVGADPDDIGILGRLGDRVDGGVHFRRGVVHGHAAGLLLLLLRRIIGGEVG